MTIADRTAEPRMRDESADRAYWAGLLHDAPRPEEPAVAPPGEAVLALPDSVAFARLARSGGGTDAVVLAGLAVHGQRLGGAAELMVAHRAEFVLTPIRLRVNPYTSFAALVRDAGVALRRARRHRFQDADDPWPDRSDRRWALAAEHSGGQWRIAVPGPGEECVRLFEQLVADPARAVGGVGAPAVLPDRNAPAPDSGNDDPAAPATLLDDFRETVRRTPEAVAVRSTDGAVSYAELEARANRWAHRLVRAGAGPETVIALAVPRSVDAVVAVYAILKAGAAFLQLDPDLPAHRRDRILDTARPLVLPQLARPGEPPVRVLEIGHIGVLDRVSAGEPATDPGIAVRGDNLAYVMFTSGSSGHPKGVGVGHAALRNQLAWMQHRFGLDTGDTVLQKTPVTFDVSLWEVLWPLQCGAQLAIPSSDGPLAPGALAELIRRFSVTTVHFVPTMLRLFRETEQLPPTVRRILVAGEAFPRDLAQRCAGGPAEVVNLYGPTEACIAVTEHRVVPGDPGPVPIGTPVHRVGCRILDAVLRPVPDGVAGELYLTGVQLARGYLNRPAETAARFVADPYNPGAGRMYRTGDLVRRRDSQLEYLGRNDFQLEIHGLRIEPAEIEAALLADETVAAAVVIADTDRLHGYLVAAPGYRIDPAAVLAGLADRLPGSLHPHTLTVLDSLPSTTAGKIDRGALPEPVVPEAAYRAPEDPVAETLAGVYAEVLGRERIGADDSFFALGGDSIMSILLVARAKAHGIAITAQQVFEHRTPAALAAAAGTATAPVLAELPGAGIGEMPLPPAAAYLVHRGGGWRRFVQALELELPVGITAGQLAATLSVVLERHDMLRSRLYRDAGGQWRLFADATAAVRIEDLVDRVPLAPGLDAEARTALAAEAFDSALSRLDPAAGAVLRFVWLDPGTSRDEPAGRLIVVAHHIAVDGVSWRILVPDLIAAWTQVAAGRIPVLPPVATSMRRWTHALAAESRQPARIAELEHWQEVTGGEDPPLAGRPFDPARDLAAAVRYTTFEFDEKRTAAVLSTVAERYHTGANEILLTALVLAVATWRPREEVLVRLEGHGRAPDIAPGADISRTVGWFTALYPVRFRLAGIDIAEAAAGGASLGQAVKAVKEQIRSVPGHGIGYGLLRYLNPDTAPALPRAEPGQIVFNYLGSVAATAIPDELAGLGWIPAADAAALPRTPDPDMPAAGALELDIIVVSGRLHVTIGYPETLLDRAAGDAFVAQYETMLGLLADHAETARGGYTPSDFPLVQVGQPDIDRWERRYPGLVDIWPVGPMQGGLFYHAVHSGRSVDPYVFQLVVTLAGAVDAGRLRAAARAVLAAHPSLRTAFHAADSGIPVAVVPAAVSLPWSEIGVETDSDIGALLAAERGARFDLTRPPLIRFTLVRYGPERAKLVVTSHHIVFDGWSVPLLMRDLLTHYADPGREHTGPRPSYRDYLRWLTRWDRTAAEQAWRSALSEATPTQIAAPAAPAPPGTQPLEEELLLSEEVSRRIAETAAESGVTVNTVMQAAWALVLGEYTGAGDIVFGATVSGRPPDLPGIESIVGLFINTVAVRVRLDPVEPVATLLTRLHTEQSELARHHHLSLAEIQACATGARQELFDTLLVFESYPFDPGLATAASLDGLSVTGFESYEATHFPLALTIWPGVGPVPRVGVANRIRVVASHWPGGFAPAAVRSLLTRFGAALAAVGTQPETVVGEWALTPGARSADNTESNENRRDPQ